MGLNKYNTLSDCKSKLSNGYDDVSSVNRYIDNISEQLSEAVKGDYYSVSGWDFSSYKESSPDNDSKIVNSKYYVQQEMDAIKGDIKVEEAEKKAAAEKLLAELD